MIDLFYRGDPFFMGILTLLLFIIFGMGLFMVIRIRREKTLDVVQTQVQLSHIRSVGLFTFVFGIFSQLLGLYGAFHAIASWGSISPDMLATGLWTSSITSIYGALIFLLSYLIWFGLTTMMNHITQTHATANHSSN
uniref:MotA/TolQ/ExbB proton channel family protein n=1 Tax=Roseihalotalea indica TaxID=2867963 RepID=A0AA49GSW7_9BACT|nr:MotA/TolQ/ExbB proton channel family protein [Tunicatimonas sp. TK19036]